MSAEISFDGLENMGVYGVAFITNSTRWPDVVESQRQKGKANARHYLKPGFYQVQASYDGPGSMTLALSHDDTRSQIQSIKIPAGDGTRSSGITDMVIPGDGYYLYGTSGESEPGHMLYARVFSIPDYKPAA